MDRIPRCTVTGGTVAARCKVLTVGKTDQTTVAVMTASAGVMDLRICIIDKRRRIAVTAGTISGGYLH